MWLSLCLAKPGSVYEGQLTQVRCFGSVRSRSDGSGVGLMGPETVLSVSGVGIMGPETVWAVSGEGLMGPEMSLQLICR